MNPLRSFFAQPAMPLYARIFLGLLRRMRIGHLVLVMPDGDRSVFGDR